MKVFYSDSPMIEPVGKSIFLAGPSPRGEKDPALNWRLEAIEILKTYSSELIPDAVYVPLPEHGSVTSYDHQVDWEEFYLERVSAIVFWIPRDKDVLIGLTTNFEFGEYYKSPRVIYGRPPNAYKTQYLDHKFRRHNPTKWIYSRLPSVITQSLLLINDK